jgi:hypothetical protein
MAQVAAELGKAATRRGGPTLRERAKTRLIAAIRRIHKASDGTYGAPRMTRELRHAGQRVNHKRMERLNARAGIVGHRPRRRRSLVRRPHLHPD